MHNTALRQAQLFFKEYVEPMGTCLTVLDLGSYSVNGSLKSIFVGEDEKEPVNTYVGIDMSEGPNVDIVCTNDKIPLPDQHAHVIVSTSSFEHDPTFWLTFLEMCRLTKPGGYIYICAPSKGHYHAYPGDCWRFYKDSWDALAKWGQREGYKVTLVRQNLDEKAYWGDSVGVFQLNPDVVPQ